MAGHVHAQAWQWIAEGKSIQARRKGFIAPQKWAMFPVDFNPEATVLALMGDEQWEFRVAPRTLTIAGKTIEAPIESIRNDEVCYTSDQCGNTTAIRFSDQNKQHCTALVKNRLFATPEAAKAAYDAITALMAPGG